MSVLSRQWLFAIGLIAPLTVSAQSALVPVVDLARAEIESLPQNIQENGLEGLIGSGQVVLDAAFVGIADDYQLIKVTVSGTIAEKGDQCSVTSTGINGDELRFRPVSYADWDGRSDNYVGFDIGCGDALDEPVSVYLSTKNQDPEIMPASSTINAMVYYSATGEADREWDVTIMEDHDVTGAGVPLGSQGTSATISADTVKQLRFYGQVDKEGMVKDNKDKRFDVTNATIYVWLK